VVEAEQAHLSLDWQRSIAHTIFAEGLAMRVTQHLHPGLPDKDYVANSPRTGLHERSLGVTLFSTTLLLI
jgi:hypothetical protein